MRFPDHPCTVSSRAMDGKVRHAVGLALGGIYAVLAFVSWGVFPIYWKPFADVVPWETLSHRVIWSFVDCRSWFS